MLCVFCIDRGAANASEGGGHIYTSYDCSLFVMFNSPALAVASALVPVRCNKAIKRLQEPTLPPKLAQISLKIFDVPVDETKVPHDNYDILVLVGLVQ